MRQMTDSDLYIDECWFALEHRPGSTTAYQHRSIRPSDPSGW